MPLLQTQAACNAGQSTCLCRTIFTLTLVATLSGCATVYGGRYAMSDGWRFGWVTQVGTAQDMRDALLKQCLAPKDSSGPNFAMVNIRNVRTARAIAVALPPGAQLKQGDAVYVNVRTCEMVAETTL